MTCRALTFGGQTFRARPWSKEPFSRVQLSEYPY